MQKTLHEQIRSQERERDAGAANITLNRAVIALETTFCALISSQLRQLYDMPNVTSLGRINQATLHFFHFSARRNKEEQAVHTHHAAGNALWLGEGPPDKIQP